MMEKFIDKLSITNTFILGVLVIVVLVWIMNSPIEVVEDTSQVGVVASGLEGRLDNNVDVMEDDQLQYSETKEEKTEISSVAPVFGFGGVIEKKTSPTSSDTIPPLLINILVTNITSEQAMIVWETKEPATGKVYFSSKTPVDFKTVPSIQSTTLKEKHSFTIPGLKSKTKYYFVLESVDASGNKGTAIESSFETLEAVN